ncbi:MAG: hypothetical protein ACPGYT_08660 [Nitrospirales bacterium]
MREEPFLNECVKRKLTIVMTLLLIVSNSALALELRKEERHHLAQKMFREISMMVPNIADEFFSSAYPGSVEVEKANLLKNIAKVQGGMGDSEGLRETAARAISLAKERGSMSVLLTQIADAQIRAGFTDDSVETMETALEVALSHKTDQMFDAYLYFIWLTFMNAGKIERAVEVAKLNSNDADIANALETLASHQAQAGQLEQAQKLREESERLSDRIDDPRAKAYFLLKTAKNMVKVNAWENASKALRQARVVARAILKPKRRSTLLLKIAAQERKIGSIETYQELLEEVQREIELIRDGHNRVDRYLNVASILEEEHGKESARPMVKKALAEALLIPDLSEKSGALLGVADAEIEFGESAKAKEVIQLVIRAIEMEAIPDRKILALLKFRNWKDVWGILENEELARLEHILETLPSDVQKEQRYDLGLLIDVKARRGLIDQAEDTADRMQKDPESRAHAIYKIARAKAATQPLHIYQKWADELISPLDRVNAYYGIGIELLNSRK